MRNVLVVLVPLCFGLTSGFIVPRGIQEVITDSEKDTASSNSNGDKRNDLVLTKNTFASKTNTANTPNNVLDKEIFDNIETKISNVKERAYIYIKPVRNRIHNNPIKIPPAYIISDKSYLVNLNKVFEEVPKQLSLGCNCENLQINTEVNKDHKCQAMKAKQAKHNKLSKTQYKTLSRKHQQHLDVLNNPSITNEGKYNKEIRKGDSSITFYSHASNIKSDNKYLLDELIKQKFDEKGSLFGCQDCDVPKKPKLSDLHKELICKCNSNLLQEVEKTEHGP